MSDGPGLHTLRRIARRVRKYYEADRHSPIWERKMGYKVKWHLGGLCLEAAVHIVSLAEMYGMDGVRVVDSHDGGHSFVRWRGWIIDVTATQFNNRRSRVCIVRADRKRIPDYWRES